MKDSTLEILKPFLNVLRGYTVLEEVRPAAFYLQGKDFLHFHELEDGLVCDVWLTKGRVRMPVLTASEQAEILDHIESKLEALESHKSKGNRKNKY